MYSLLKLFPKRPFWQIEKTVNGAIRIGVVVGRHDYRLCLDRVDEKVGCEDQGNGKRLAGSSQSQHEKLLDCVLLLFCPQG